MLTPSNILKESVHRCFVFENAGIHRVIAQTPDLPPLRSADDIIGNKSFSMFFRLLGTERLFCLQGTEDPMIIICPSEHKTVSIAILLTPTASAKTDLSSDIAIDPHIPYRFRRSVLDSARAIYDFFFRPINTHIASEDDPVAEVLLASKLSLFFKQFEIPCEVYMQPKEELPVFGNNESGILFFLAALCIKLAQIKLQNRIYLQATPTRDGFLLDIAIPSLPHEQTDVLRDYMFSVLHSPSDFPFAFGIEDGVLKIRYYPLKTDESLFGMKRPGTNG